MTNDEVTTALARWKATKHDPLAHRRADKRRRIEKEIIFSVLKEFDPEDLACVADSLRDRHESVMDVGTGENLETDTAYAARFIRRYLEILNGELP